MNKFWKILVDYYDNIVKSDEEDGIEHIPDLPEKSKSKLVHGEWGYIEVPDKEKPKE